MNQSSVLWAAIVNGQFVHALSEGLVLVVAAMMDDDDLHCHCGWQ